MPYPNERGTRLTERIPRKACIAQMGQVLPAPAAAAEGENKKPLFRMNAHTGRIMKHWYWGNWAIDLKGITVNRQRMPALLAHNAEAIAGWTEKIEVDEKQGILAEGVYAESTDIGRSVRALQEEGFPWQASVYVPPAEIEMVGENKSAEVNGQTLKGPGAIFRKSTLREVSFCALGADERTSVAAAAEGDSIEVEVLRHGDGTHGEPREQGQEENMELSELKLEELKAGRPDLLQEVEEKARGEAEKAERERVLAVLKDAGEFPDVPKKDELVRAAIDGGDARDAAMSRLKDARLAALEQASPATTGPNAEPETRASVAGLEGEELFKAEWEKGTKEASVAELRREFGDDPDAFNAYCAYRRAEDKGLVEILGN